MKKKIYIKDSYDNLSDLNELFDLFMTDNYPYNTKTSDGYYYFEPYDDQDSWKYYKELAEEAFNSIDSANTITSDNYKKVKDTIVDFVSDRIWEAFEIQESDLRDQIHSEFSSYLLRNFGDDGVDFDDDVISDFIVDNVYLDYNDRIDSVLSSEIPLTVILNGDEVVIDEDKQNRLSIRDVETSSIGLLFDLTGHNLDDLNTLLSEGFDTAEPIDFTESVVVDINNFYGNNGDIVFLGGMSLSDMFSKFENNEPLNVSKDSICGLTYFGDNGGQYIELDTDLIVPFGDYIFSNISDTIDSLCGYVPSVWEGKFS